MTDYRLLLPEFLMAGVAFLVAGLDLVTPAHRKKWLAYLGAAGCVAVAGSSMTLLHDTASLYGGLFLVDRYALLFKVFFSLVGAVILIASADFVTKRLSHPGEFFAIVIFAVLGMMVMTAAGELLTAYIALELLSFSLYVLASFDRMNLKSNEAGIKYILIGAASSALLLYGLSLLYGGLHTTTYAGMADALGGDVQKAVVAGIVLVVVGIGFKIAAAPFHMWAPDVYEGAPVPVTAYIAVASKLAGFALLLRLFATAFAPALTEWQGVVVAVAAISMTLGNFVALAQSNIKRLMAYSGIGQSGYMLMGIAALTPLASDGLLYHMAGFAVSSLAAFMVIITYSHLTGKEEIGDYAGLADRSPLMALTLSVALFSLAGLPIFVGFSSKFYLFAATAKSGFLWLVGLAIVNSLISLYYYLMVIKQMYIGKADDKSLLRVPVPLGGLMGLLTAGVILFGVYPRPLLDAIGWATRALF